MAAIKLKDLKPGEFFTLKPIEEPKESQVYIRAEYDRTERKYWAQKDEDMISYYRVCDVCGKIMLEGWYDGDGTGKYYCSEECLCTDYESLEYWEENIYSDDGDSYYTEWGY